MKGSVMIANLLVNSRTMSAMQYLEWKWFEK